MTVLGLDQDPRVDQVGDLGQDRPVMLISSRQVPSTNQTRPRTCRVSAKVRNCKNTLQLLTIASSCTGLFFGRPLLSCEPLLAGSVIPAGQNKLLFRVEKEVIVLQCD